MKCIVSYITSEYDTIESPTCCSVVELWREDQVIGRGEI